MMYWAIEIMARFLLKQVSNLENKYYFTMHFGYKPQHFNSMLAIGGLIGVVVSVLLLLGAEDVSEYRTLY